MIINLKKIKFTRFELLTVVVIFLTSLAIRSYKLSDSLFFGFEQGRDALIIQDILKFKHLPLVGPPTSIPGIFHGASYYYFMSLPYAIGSGNPLVASFFTVFISSLLSVVAYFFARAIFGSRKWGLIFALLVTFSYEYILYARWLSHVPFAVLTTLLAFFMLWKFSKLNQEIYLISFFFFAALASLFEMILIPQFLLVFILLLSLKIINITSLKPFLVGLITSFILLSPFLIFDFRHGHISVNGFLNFVGNSESPRNYLGAVRIFLVQSYYLFYRAVIYINIRPLVLASLVISLFGFWLYLKKNYQNGMYIGLWGLMGLPLIFIGPGNPHYYFGVGLSWILIFCAGLKGLWDHHLRFGTIILLVLVFISATLGLQNLSENKNIFFVTIQDDLNYADQKRVLDFIHNDSNNQHYILRAFTIPYLHPEGWQYLHKYFYPQDTSRNAKLLYIIIERNVASVWEEKWIAELGQTALISEQKIGLLRIQKRVIQ